MKTSTTLEFSHLASDTPSIAVDYLPLSPEAHRNCVRVQVRVPRVRPTANDVVRCLRMPTQANLPEHSNTA